MYYIFFYMSSEKWKVIYFFFSKISSPSQVTPDSAPPPCWCSPCPFGQGRLLARGAGAAGRDVFCSRGGTVGCDSFPHLSPRPEALSDGPGVWVPTVQDRPHLQRGDAFCQNPRCLQRAVHSLLPGAGQTKGGCCSEPSWRCWGRVLGGFQPRAEGSRWARRMSAGRVVQKQHKQEPNEALLLAPNLSHHCGWCSNAFPAPPPGGGGVAGGSWCPQSMPRGWG